MKKNKIQLIINIITIINIIAIIIWLYHFIINKKYSRANVRKILEKNIYTNNYIIEGINNDTGSVFRRITQNEKARQEELKSNYGPTTIWYINNLNFYMIERNGKKYMRIEKEETKDKISLLKDESCIPLLDNAKFFKYLKNEKYQDKECIVIALSETKNYKDGGNKIWIDIENGFVIRNEYYSDGIITNIEEYKIETNVVEDNDIEIPSIEGYILVTQNDAVSIYEKNES